MLHEDLKNLVKTVQTNRAESQTIELKSAHQGCPKRLYDTLSSFANQDDGGVILFGIDESLGYEIVGVYDLQDLQKKVTEQCLQMEPVVRAVFTQVTIDGKNVCSAEIPGIDLSERPCFYKGIGRFKGSYIRVGDADLPMTDYELYSYEAYRKHLHDDERIVERATFSALDKKKVSEYVDNKQIEKPGFAQISEEMTYELLNITRNGTPTLAAIMNFCVYPQGYFPQFAITAVVVPGIYLGETSENGARFIDNKRIDGTLATMVEEAIVFCVRNTKSQTIIDNETGKRVDRREYPIAAVREAILNAVIHRDYSIYTEGTPIQIYLYSDRMEIHSPGCLYGRMTVDQLGIAKPDLRNPALAVMAEELTESENRYSGIPTMRREMKKYGLPAPVFENRRNEFVVTFYNETHSTGKVMKLKEDRFVFDYAPKEDNSLLEFCRTPRSRQEIAEFLGIKTIFYVSEKYIQPLLEEGLLKMTIPDKPKSRNQRFYAVK